MSTICEVPDTCLERIERITGALSYFCCQGLGVYEAALTYLTFLGSDRPPVEANARRILLRLPSFIPGIFLQFATVRPLSINSPSQLLNPKHPDRRAELDVHNS
jgi:hypothetical protein